MSVVQSQDPVIMSFTNNAADKVHSLISEEGNDQLKLRVFVTGGGCSGFQYGFSFDEETNEDDTIIENNGASLLVDPLSYQYLVGASIDYVKVHDEDLDLNFYLAKALLEDVGKGKNLTIKGFQ